MKNILIALGLLIGTLAYSEPHGLDVIAQNYNPHPAHPPASSAQTAVDDVISILLVPDRVLAQDNSCFFLILV